MRKPFVLSFLRRASAFIGERAQAAAGLIDNVAGLKNIRTFTDTISKPRQLAARRRMTLQGSLELEILA